MKRSKLLLLAAIIGTICVILCFTSLNSAVESSKTKDDAYQAGTLIGATIALPSTLISAISTIFAWVGFGTNKRGFALASGILYAVAIVLMLPWFMFNIVQMVLCFIAYGLMGKNNG